MLFEKCHTFNFRHIVCTVKVEPKLNPVFGKAQIVDFYEYLFWTIMEEKKTNFK